MNGVNEHVSDRQLLLRALRELERLENASTPLSDVSLVHDVRFHCFGASWQLIEPGSSWSGPHGIETVLGWGHCEMGSGNADLPTRVVTTRSQSGRLLTRDLGRWCSEMTLVNRAIPTYEAERKSQSLFAQEEIDQAIREWLGVEPPVLGERDGHAPGGQRRPHELVESLFSRWKSRSPLHQAVVISELDVQLIVSSAVVDMSQRENKLAFWTAQSIHVLLGASAGEGQ